MPVQMLKLERAHDADLDTYFLPAEKRLQGNPRQAARVDYAASDGSFEVGVWHSEPGKWKIRYSEDEYCQMLFGRCAITDEAGHTTIVATGDHFVIPRGFTGTWETLETCAKRFVIHNPPAAG